jgi:hypothetical protein
MGDKGGKKDKEKNQQQHAKKQQQKEQRRQDKVPPKTAMAINTRSLSLHESFDTRARQSL